MGLGALARLQLLAALSGGSWCGLVRRCADCVWALQKRAAMLASRSRDPAVLVDIPQDPNADEVAAANTIAGQVTPALPSGEMDGVVESVERIDKS